MRQIIQELKLPRPPFWMIAAAIIFVVLTWIPLSLIFRASVTRSPKTAIHLFHDMDHQPKHKAQSASVVFADGRSMRPPVPGAVARGQLDIDDHFYRGFKTDGDLNPVVIEDDQGTRSRKWMYDLPASLEVDSRFVKRGRTMFNIYCYPCHGRDGYGNGPVNDRALLLMKKDPSDNLWTQAANFHQINPETGELKYGDKLYPDGKMFHVISNGLNNMPAYRSQIGVEDRWAIVAYTRALQLSQRAPGELVPTEKRNAMKGP